MRVALAQWLADTCSRWPHDVKGVRRVRELDLEKKIIIRRRRKCTCQPLVCYNMRHRRRRASGSQPAGRCVFRTY